MADDFFAHLYPFPDNSMFDPGTALGLDAMEATMHGWDGNFGYVDRGEDWSAAYVPTM